MFDEFVWKTIHLAILFSFFIASLMSNILHYLVIKSSNPLRALDHYSNSCSPPHWHLNRIRGCICPFPSSSLAGPNSFAKTLGCWAPWTLNECPGSSLHGTPRFSERSSFFPAFTPYWAPEWTEWAWLSSASNYGLSDWLPAARTSFQPLTTYTRSSYRDWF